MSNGFAETAYDVIFSKRVFANTDEEAYSRADDGKGGGHWEITHVDGVPRSPAPEVTAWIGVVESRDAEITVIVCSEELSLLREAAAVLNREGRASMADDLDDFYREHGLEDPRLTEEPALRQWLADFHEATTDPWLTVHSETLAPLERPGVDPDVDSLRVDLSPAALREHYEAGGDSQALADLDDAALREIGQTMLGDDQLWATFGDVLDRALADYTRRPGVNPVTPP